ncbi:MAG TPA: histidine kinase [Opitutaceae bacterium]|nr:histidine kinase [Opitutaceae bacterium]
MRADHQFPATRTLYVRAQLAGWGAFLILRLWITATYCAKTPGMNALDACLLETASHLTGAVWSHITWLWLNHRRLLDRGLKRLVIEGLLVANLGTIPLLLVTWYPTTAIYTMDFARFGGWAIFWIIVGQNTLITALWFWSFVALLYFDRTRRLELDHAEARAVAREAQLHALRGQINPHFLFNSFNSLRALIAIDPARATDSLTQLSGLLRYSLASAERLVVPLAEELLIVQRYLELERLRLGPRLSVVAEISGQAANAVLPPMLLQSLVENAVKFGPSARKAGGEVVYTVALEQNRLRIKVTNPGRLAGGSDSTGLGLRNLRDRLRLLYGAAASFTLREEGELVVAEAELPAELPEPACPALLESARADVRAPIVRTCGAGAQPKPLTGSTS